MKEKNRSNKKIILGSFFKKKRLLLNNKDLKSYYACNFSNKVKPVPFLNSLILKKKGLYRIISSSIIMSKFKEKQKELPKIFLPLTRETFNQPKFRISKLQSLKNKDYLYSRSFCLSKYSGKNKKRKVQVLKNLSSSKYLSDLAKNQFIFNKFVRILMKKGKLSISEKSLKVCCDIIWSKHKINPLLFFAYALDNLRPLIELEKKGKNNFSKKQAKTIPVLPNKGYKIAIDWILQGVSQRKERSLGYKIYLELFDACLEKGYAFKQKQELYKICRRTFYSQN